jgi:hypothetical protein
MSVQAKKKSEGDAHVKAAEKALKTSLTKWSPDHDTAGDEFSKAATCYKVRIFLHCTVIDKRSHSLLLPRLPKHLRKPWIVWRRLVSATRIASLSTRLARCWSKLSSFAEIVTGKLITDYLQLNQLNLFCL